MKTLERNFGQSGRYAIRLTYEDRRYQLTVDCADDLTREEYIAFDVCLEAVRQGLHFYPAMGLVTQPLEDDQEEFVAELEAEWASPLPYGFELPAEQKAGATDDA